MHTLLRLPPLEPTTHGEESSVHSRPSNQYPKIQSNPRMQPKQYLPTPLHNRMQRPRVSPAVETGRDLDVVEGRGHVGYDPEDKEETHPAWFVRYVGKRGRGEECLPRLTNNHSHVFACQTQRNHAEEIQHPIHGERAVAVGYWITCNHTNCQLSHLQQNCS
jgi:hypothetical protein